MLGIEMQEVMAQKAETMEKKISDGLHYISREEPLGKGQEKGVDISL